MIFHRGYVSKALSWSPLEAAQLRLKRPACQFSVWSSLQAFQKCLMVTVFCHFFCNAYSMNITVASLRRLHVALSK